jgi:hypothetical protein
LEHKSETAVLPEAGHELIEGHDYLGTKKWKQFVGIWKDEGWFESVMFTSEAGGAFAHASSRGPSQANGQERSYVSSNGRWPVHLTESRICFLHNPHPQPIKMAWAAVNVKSHLLRL